MTLRDDANKIIEASIQAVLPDEAVKKALSSASFLQNRIGNIYMVSCGKAAWQMGYAASNVLGDNLHAGVVVTKYDHVKGNIPKTTCYEAGHPVPDSNSFLGTQAAIDAAKDKLNKGEIKVFDTKTFTVGGKELTDRLADVVDDGTFTPDTQAIVDGRFIESEKRSAPYFNVIIDGITVPEA